jgi:hypothetical protein
VVPRYFAIDEAHRVGDALEASLGRALEGEDDFVVHLDPCRPMHCAGCAMAECPVRSAPLTRPVSFDVPSLTEQGPV